MIHVDNDLVFLSSFVEISKAEVTKLVHSIPDEKTLQKISF